MAKQADPVITQVMSERNQTFDTRRQHFARLERLLGRPVVSYFTSFVYPVMIEDSDADILEGILQKLDLSEGLALVISSPGGNGLASERIINVCRSYSGTKEYWAIVPGKAKSAATMVCFGASKIIMGATSELGPVDPQVPISDKGSLRWFSAYNLVRSYEDLFQKAVETQGHLEPYLQQLANYDEREIAELRAQISLADDIATKTLGLGMMKGTAKKGIAKKIDMFLTPKRAKTHGRPIFADEAAECGLAIEKMGGRETVWRLIYELYIRTNDYVSHNVAKCIESKNHSFYVSIMRGGVSGEFGRKEESE